MPQTAQHLLQPRFHPQTRDTTRARERPQLALALRIIGAAGLLAMAGVHLYLLLADHYTQIPTIGTLFWLNVAGGVVLAVMVLALPHRLVALAGAAVAVAAIVALFISENGGLFGFEEYGYRASIVIAIGAEAAAAVALVAFAVVRSRVDR